MEIVGLAADAVHNANGLAVSRDGKLLYVVETDDNRSQDATFFHDWMFSRGNGLGVPMKAGFDLIPIGKASKRVIPEAALLRRGELVAVNMDTGNIAYRKTLGVSDMLPPGLQDTGRPKGSPPAKIGGVERADLTRDDPVEAAQAGDGVQHG